MALERVNKGDENPYLPVAQRRPSRHGGPTHAAANNTIDVRRARRFRPRRQGEISRRRIHPFAPYAVAITFGAVTNCTMGGKQRAARRLRLARRQ